MYMYDELTPIHQHSSTTCTSYMKKSWWGQTSQRSLDIHVHVCTCVYIHVHVNGMCKVGLWIRKSIIGKQLIVGESQWGLLGCGCRYTCHWQLHTHIVSYVLSYTLTHTHHTWYLYVHFPHPVLSHTQDAGPWGPFQDLLQSPVQSNKSSFQKSDSSKVRTYMYNVI